MTRHERVKEIVRAARQYLGLPEVSEGHRTRQESVPGTIFNRPVEIPTLDFIKVLKVVKTNYDKPVTRAQVARRFRVTPRAVSGLFAEMGLTFESHVRQLRLYRAKRLLGLIRRKLPKSSRSRFIRQKVAEVRVKVGWEGGEESFRGAFKKLFGTTPQGYLIGILDMQTASKKEGKDAIR